MPYNAVCQLYVLCDQQDCFVYVFKKIQCRYFCHNATIFFIFLHFVCSCKHSICTNVCRTHVLLEDFNTTTVLKIITFASTGSVEGPVISTIARYVAISALRIFSFINITQQREDKLQTFYENFISFKKELAGTAEYAIKYVHTFKCICGLKVNELKIID